MPWVRIDENANDHPKFTALPDGAFRLWVEGLSYCQKHLTDGVIQIAALKGFRHFTTAKMKALLTPYQDGANALWKQPDAKTITVHDYLDWNDSRDEVLAARANAQERRQRYKDRHASKDASSDALQTPTATASVLCGVVGSEGLRSSNQEKGFTVRTNGHPSKPLDPSDDAALSERAGRFCERYAEMHAKYRHGARYMSKPNLDFLEALQIVRVWDDERLDKLAQAFLTTDDEWVASGTRTMARFRSRASWCDERLREAGL